MVGPPKGPEVLRVSATRQGVTGTKREPVWAQAAVPSSASQATAITRAFIVDLEVTDGFSFNNYSDAARNNDSR
jgi:hypothetical protein